MTVKTKTSDHSIYEYVEEEAKKIIEFYEKLGYKLEKIVLKHILFIGPMYYVMWFSRKD